MQKLSLVDETFDLNFISEYHLSIQFSLDGLSFCILDGIQKKYVLLSYQPHLNADSPLITKNLQEFFQGEEKINKSFKSVHLTYSSPRATLIPHTYFSEEKSKNILKLNYGDSSTDETFTNTLPSFSGKLIVGIPDKLKGFIKKQYPGQAIIHECLPFLWSANLSVSADKFVAVFIRKDYFWLIYSDKGQLKFFNSFAYQTDDDILYFSLNMISSLGLDPEKTPIYMEGMASKKAAIYHRFRQYLKHVQLAAASPDYHYSYLFDQIPDSRFVTLLNLQACAL